MCSDNVAILLVYVLKIYHLKWWKFFNKISAKIIVRLHTSQIIINIILTSVTLGNITTPAPITLTSPTLTTS